MALRSRPLAALGVLALLAIALGLIVTRPWHDGGPRRGEGLVNGLGPVHADVTATVFWIGEPKGGGSSEDNSLSAWDDAWLAHYGGVDEPRPRRAYPYFPAFTPQENPFYFDLPYDDFQDDGVPRPDRLAVVPWAHELTGALARAEAEGRPFSLLKNRWAEIWRTVDGRRLVAYAQWEDAGPYVYDDAGYVFGEGRPRNRRANGAGLDVSPAVRDALEFAGWNDDENAVSWRFVAADQVPDGPWKRVVTTSQVHWSAP